MADALIGMEEAEGSEGEEEAAEVACPFCDEEFDGFGLCCHIEDEHQAENRAGVIIQSIDLKPETKI